MYECRIHSTIRAQISSWDTHAFHSQIGSELLILSLDMEFSFIISLAYSFFICSLGFVSLDSVEFMKRLSLMWFRIWMRFFNMRPKSQFYKWKIFQTNKLLVKCLFLALSIEYVLQCQKYQCINMNWQKKKKATI